MTDLRISVRNTSEDGGTFLTPFYFGFHDGNFDLFDAGAVASPGLEALAEDGNFMPVAAERLAVSPDSQGLVVAGAGGPIATQEFTSNTISANQNVNTYVSFGAMILPSNDAFVGTDDAVKLFNANGTFLGAQTVVFEGTDVYDAGTEVNTELDAAFINQTGPDTGVDENGVITLHPGFNGSAGNPVGEGDQIILGGTNAFGAAIDPIAADFTLPGAQIAVVHINEVTERDGSDKRDVLRGDSSDDIVNAGDGNDLILGRSGWDVLNGDDGRDKIFAGRGDDIVDGGAGNDKIAGGAGNDVLMGGTGNDLIFGGRGDDTFVFASGDGHDVIRDFDRRGDDKISLDVDGVESLEDLLDYADQAYHGVELDFGGDGSLLLKGVNLKSLTEDDFSFG
ncbi:MAG: spondin domain-containing protein [Pseudomonadota bacterium]